MDGFVAGDRNQLFLEVEAVVEAEVVLFVVVAVEVVVFVEGVLQGAAEAPQGVVAVVVASGAEGDFRIAFCNISSAPFCVVISGCALGAHKNHHYMLILVLTCG